jgi:hypothetical protein
MIRGRTAAASSGPGGPTGTFEQHIDVLIQLYERRSRHLYRFGITLRTLAAVTAFIALLPDSGILNLSTYAELYSWVATACRVAAVVLLLILANIRLRESLVAYNDFLALLFDKRTAVVAMDTLSRELAEVDLRRELDARQAELHRGILEGLDTLISRSGS